MGVVLLNRDTLPELLRRLEQVDGTVKPLWGKMNAPEMFAHLTHNIRMALEEVPTPDESSWFKRAVLRRLIFHVLPWPKGRIAAPSYFIVPAEGDIDFERQRLREAMARFVDRATTEPFRRVRNPYFGPLPLSYWCRTLGIHVDHHFRQFGV